jgi:hypothetical protein
MKNAKTEFKAKFEKAIKLAFVHMDNMRDFSPLTNPITVAGEYFTSEGIDDVRTAKTVAKRLHSLADAVSEKAKRMSVDVKDIRTAAYAVEGIAYATETTGGQKNE